jgi:hypothetical protein
MEATGVYWKPVWHVLEGLFELLLANPTQVKALRVLAAASEGAKMAAPGGTTVPLVDGRDRARGLGTPAPAKAVTHHTQVRRFWHRHEDTFATWATGEDELVRGKNGLRKKETRGGACWLLPRLARRQRSEQPCPPYGRKPERDGFAVKC